MAWCWWAMAGHVQSLEKLLSWSWLPHPMRTNCAIKKNVVSQLLNIAVIDTEII